MNVLHLTIVSAPFGPWPVVAVRTSAETLGVC